ncbi:MAG: hypothetical protein LAP40_23375 [Acidobacteriia bacterium]|nr:hypothetical protein [Terriglobia bacterium]
MRTFLKTSVLFVMVAGLALAETYTGKLIDAACAAQQKNAACTPTASTTTFALVASGKAMRLDAAGNTKAAEALKASNSGANRAKDPNAAPGSDSVNATVTGTATGDQLKVDNIQIE